MWNYDDDWQEKKAQREQEDYDRWYGEREAEKDARAGYYSPPSYSADAYDSYEDKWSNVDSRERAEVARRAHDEEQDREQKSGSKRDNANSFDNSYNSDPETYPSINNYSSKSNFPSSNFSFSKHILINYILPIFMLIAIAKTVWYLGGNNFFGTVEWMLAHPCLFIIIFLIGCLIIGLITSVIEGHDYHN